MNQGRVVFTRIFSSGLQEFGGVEFLLSPVTRVAETEFARWAAD